MNETFSPKSSLALRLLMLVIPISLLGVGLVGFTAYYTVKQHIVENVKKDVQALSFEAAQNLSNFFKQRENDLDTISQTPLFRDYFYNDEFGLTQEAQAYQKEIEEYLAEFSKRTGVYNGIWYLNSRGRQICSIQFSSVTRDRSGFLAEDLFKEILSSSVRPRFVSAPVADARFGPTMYYAKRLSDPAGKHAYGLLVLGSTLKPVQEILDRIRIKASNKAYICDRKGNVVFPIFNSGPSPEHLPLYRSYSAISGTPWRVELWVDFADFLKPLQNIRSFTIFISIICGSLVVVCLYFVIGILIRPIKRLKQATLRLTAGNLDERVAILSKDEVGDLSRSFNVMAETLQTKAAENADLLNNIRWSEARYRTTLDCSLDAIVGLDSSFNIMTWNRGAQNLFGYADTEALAKPISMLFSNATSKKLMNQILTEGFIRNLDIDGITKMGTVVNLNLTWAGAEKEESKKKEWALVIRDVTEQKKMLAQLIQAEKLSVVGQLISGIAHEINGPLTAVVGYAELLATDDSKDPELKEDLTSIYDNSIRCRDIVSNFLRFVRKGNLRRSEVDVNEIVNAALKLMQGIVKKQNVRLHCELTPGLPPVSVDPQQIEQVIVNLIHNACDALGEREELREIRIRTTATEGAIIIEVSDNGPGIPKEICDHIFEPFFTTKQEGKGTGLGLAISQRIIQDHRGSIWVESAFNQGTTFLVALPISQGKEETSPKASPRSPRYG